jgi:hypothetical protein
MDKVYLAGPMTNLPDYNFPAFNAAAERLRRFGYEVVNPAELHPVVEDWQSSMCRDIAVMLGCDTVAYLPGWESSDGAMLELELAKRLGKFIIDAHLIQPKN